jgi:hypothetical protein
MTDDGARTPINAARDGEIWNSNRLNTRRVSRSVVTQLVIPAIVSSLRSWRRTGSKHFGALKS